ncbi:MAG: hypothetical protein M1308_17980 [Actinobacteria bacterium]|nr:hypothetical protein [Actinomycetota bacterium]
MKKIIITVLVLCAAIALVLALGGCTKNIAAKIAEKAIENAAAKEGESVDVNLEEGQVNIKDKEGNEVNIGGTTVPEGWPDVVPVNENITIQFSGSQKTDNKMNYNISGIYKGTSEDLYNFYKSALTGFTIDSDSVTDSGEDGKLYNLQSSNDKYVVSMFITDGNEEVSVILSVNEK